MSVFVLQVLFKIVQKSLRLPASSHPPLTSLPPALSLCVLGYITAGGVDSLLPYFSIKSSCVDSRLRVFASPSNFEIFRHRLVSRHTGRNTFPSWGFRSCDLGNGISHWKFLQWGLSQHRVPQKMSPCSSANGSWGRQLLSIPNCLQNT